MNGGVIICVALDKKRIQRRLDTHYLDTMVYDLNKVIKMTQDAAQREMPLSIGLIGNCIEAFTKKERTVRWIKMAQKRVKHMDLPARIC